MDKNDLYWMSQALGLAQKAKGLTSPNPCVGAILVRDAVLIGQGYHRKAGGPHAEVLAVRDAMRKGNSLNGATLYVTLEPCCTHGRTPPLYRLDHSKKDQTSCRGGNGSKPCPFGQGL